MKIMTYNICSGWNNEKPHIRDYDNACKVISEVGATVVGLNEVGKETIRGIPSHSGYMAERLGMKDVFAPAIMIGKYPYGNAFLTKHEIKDIKIINIPDAPKTEQGYYETRCLLETVIETELGEISVLVSHFGLCNGELNNAVKTVSDTVDRIKYESPDRHIILMGDFNMTPDNPILSPIFERLTEVTFSLDSVEPTFSSDDPKIKIDYIFISDKLKADRVKVIRTLASDHCPLTADISLK